MRLRTLAFALGMTACALATPTLARSPDAAAFDAAASANPGRAFDMTYEGRSRRIDGLRAIDMEVEGPDGSPARMFRALVDGQAATIVRIGDRVNIALEAETAPPPALASASARTSRSSEWSIDYGFANDLVLEEETPVPPPRGTTGPLRTLDIWVFLHENAGENDPARFVNWYVATWDAEMRESIAPDLRIRMFFKDKVDGITNMDYHSGDRVKRLQELSSLGQDYAESRGMGDSPGARYLLVVGDRGENWGHEFLAPVYGLALQKGHAAMVSNTGPRHVLAHEIGHMFGATHEDASSFPCASNMAGYVPLPSCLNYTDKNRENIRKYLDRY